MSAPLEKIKPKIKETPLWSILRPRRIHVYGVGAPKTGTVSLSRLFGHFRTAHEAHLEQTVSLIQSDFSRKKLRDHLHRRDRKWRLECEVGYPLVYVCGALSAAFPDAKFICTVRAPRSWLRSIIDQCINKPREEIPSVYRRLRDHSFGPIPEKYPPQEQPLARNGVHSLSGYLSYWAYHYRTVLDDLPAGRRLLVRTRYLSDISQTIADFVGVSESDLQTNRAHEHKTSRTHGVLEQVEQTYLRKKIDEHCSDVTNRLSREMDISL